MQNFRSQTRGRVTLGLAMISLSVLGFSSSGSAQERAKARDLEPRVAFRRPQLDLLSSADASDVIVVKFLEGTGIRFSGKRASSRTRSSVGELQAVVDQVTSQVEKIFARPESVLSQEKRVGESRSGRELADLNLFYRFHVQRHRDPLDALESILSLPQVETAYFAPRPAPSPTDLPPVTPTFNGQQNYLGPAPQGVDAQYAWSLPGGRGTGVRVCDIEYNWHTGHEEFNDVGITLLGNAPLVPPNLNTAQETYHGTASLAVVGADDNGYGTRGIASQARLYITGSFTQQGGYNPANAINLSAGALPGGSVLLLEMQACADQFCNVLVPIEWFAAEYAAIASAVANGIIVVEAAGNGGNDLSDTNQFGNAFRRSVQDSGAIMVAAGDSQGNPLFFTNHCTTDSRIDVWSWGNSNVVTAGYGDLFYGGSSDNQAYTTTFGGTSSASAIVAGCVANLQGIAQQMLGKTLTPAEVRSIFTTTGTPQAVSAMLIGSQPNLRTATAYLMDQEIQLLPFQFVPGMPSPNPLSPGEILATDLNRDGSPELIFSYQDNLTFTGTMEIVLNNGGVYGPSIPFPLGFGQPFLATGDFNQDGNPDIAATTSTLVTVFLGDGSLGFLNVIPVPLPVAGFGTEIADFTGDGKPDIAVAHSGLLSVLVGDGLGNFTFTSFAYPAQNWIDVEACDMTGDGAIDWCLTGSDTTILVNDGSGTPVANPFSTNAPGTSIVTGDLDQDGRKDIAVLSPGGGTLTSFKGDGAGLATQTSVTSFPLSILGNQVILQDFNGDLLLDAAISGVQTPIPGGGTQDGPALLLGDGRGAFGPPGGSFSLGFGFGGIAAGNLAGLNQTDVALAVLNPGGFVDVELFVNPIFQKRMKCRTGNVNETLGVAVDVLSVSGQTGDVDRILRLSPSTTFTIDMAAPQNGPASAPYVLYAVRGQISFTDETNHPFNIGTTCFPTPLSGGTLPNTVVVANSLGYTGLLGTPLLNRGPAPGTVATVVGGLPAGSRLFLQGFIRDNNGQIAITVTNGVEVQVW